MNYHASIPLAAGALLVAAPAVDDPHFARSVVLLLAHGTEDGAMGIILNRPMDAVVGDPTSPLHPWVESAAVPAVLFEGGPVETTGFICLTEDSSAQPGVSSMDIIEDDPASVTAPHRVFRGYAGWAPGQLEAEILVGGWFVLPALRGDAFTGDPEGLWRAVLARQGGELAAIARFPADPNLN
ncbi:MAG: YqgE/AlgH family protein [Actinomycetota bacterium]